MRERGGGLCGEEGEEGGGAVVGGGGVKAGREVGAREGRVRCVFWEVERLWLGLEEVFTCGNNIKTTLIDLRNAIADIQRPYQTYIGRLVHEHPCLF